MYAWVVRKMIRRSIDRLNAGDIGPLVAGFADDATLVFPGRSSWAGEYRGKQEIAEFLDRFVSVGLRGVPEEIVVKGPPWNTTVCVRFRDEAMAPDGSIIYANRALLFAKAAWGRIVFQEDYLDTEKVAEFDRHLQLNEVAHVTEGRSSVMTLG
jgi:ketosteroid isomerase-like protein